MKYDVILAGVGGQGILTVAYLLDNAAVNRGLRFKQAEVHGMAQRGGAVYSHMRVSDEEIISDIIPEGRADMILSVEPLEVHRYLNMLSVDGVVVSNVVPVVNIQDYPDHKIVIDALYGLPRPVGLDAGAIAKEAGVSRAENMAMAGAATAYMPFELADYEPVIRKLFSSKGEEMVAANMRVLENGYKVGAFTRALLEAGISGDCACRFVALCNPGTLDVTRAGDVARSFSDDVVRRLTETDRDGLVSLDDLIFELG